MPKFSKDQAQAVRDAMEEGANRFSGPVPPGVYLAKLTADGKPGKTGTGKSKYTWLFELQEGQPGRQVYYDTLMVESCYWQLANLFQAFNGDPSKDDTKKFAGRNCLLVIDNKVAEQGKYAGKPVHYIAAMRPADQPESKVDAAEPIDDKAPF